MTTVSTMLFLVMVAPLLYVAECKDPAITLARDVVSEMVDVLALVSPRSDVTATDDNAGGAGYNNKVFWA